MCLLNAIARNLARVFAALLIYALPATSVAQVVMNEFVAENGASATDEDGANPDWIELLNTTAADVNLDGWFLSDDPLASRTGRRFDPARAGKG